VRNSNPKIAGILEKAAKGVTGKRLTYRRTRRPEEAEEPEIPF
jgi:hypothetical protein